MSARSTRRPSVSVTRPGCRRSTRVSTGSLDTPMVSFGGHWWWWVERWWLAGMGKSSCVCGTTSVCCCGLSGAVTTAPNPLNPNCLNQPDEGLQSTVLCPYTCLNLGSFATLFKLPYNCICDQDKLQTMERTSATISTVSDWGRSLESSLRGLVWCKVQGAHTLDQITTSSAFNSKPPHLIPPPTLSLS